VRVAKCRFFLELVVYHDEMDEKGPEFARIKPQTVIGSLQEFSSRNTAWIFLKSVCP